jgi:hypothetical protein
MEIVMVLSRRTVIVLAVVVPIVAVAVIAFLIYVFVVLQSVRGRSRRMATVDAAAHRHARRFPRNRVPDSEMPKGVTRTPVSNSPVIDTLANFMTPAEVAHFLTLAQGRFQPSVVVDPATSNLVTNPDRTSTSVFLSPAEDDVVARVEARAAQAMGMPVSHLESLQVVRYEPGQFYKPHYDYIDPAAKDVQERGQRVATILVYLNTLPEDEAGGGTKFPHLDITVKPVAGTAVLWHNVTATTHVDPRTLHAGEPVQHATKYAVNIWFRERPQQGR